MEFVRFVQYQLARTVRNTYPGSSQAKKVQMLVQHRHLNLFTCPPFLHSAFNQVRKVFYCQSFVNSKVSRKCDEAKRSSQSNSKDHQEAKHEKLCSWKTRRWKNWKKIQITGTVTGHNELTTNPGMLAWRDLTTQREGRLTDSQNFKKTCHENFRPSILIGWLSQSFLFNCSSFSSFCEDSLWQVVQVELFSAQPFCSSS